MIRPKTKDNFQAFIDFIVIGCIGALFFLIFEHTYAPNSLWIKPFDLVAFVVSSTLALTLIVLYIWFKGPKLKESRFSLVVFIILLTVALVSLVNVIVSPAKEVIMYQPLERDALEVVIERPLKDKVFSIGLLFLNITLFYSLFVVLPSQKRFPKILNYVATIFLLYLFGIIIYSLVKEIDLYKDILANGLKKNTITPTSIFDNRNTYASFLLTGIMYNFFLYFKSGEKKIRYIFPWLGLIPTIFIYFTYSKTNIILALIVYLIIIVRHYIKNIIKKRWVYFGIETLLLSFIIFVFVGFRYIPSLLINPFGQKLLKMIPRDFIFISKRTIIGRIEIWKTSYKFISLNDRTFILGEGLYLSRKIAYAGNIIDANFENVNGFTNYHNGFIEVFHTFGLFGLVLYCFMIIYLFVGIIRLFFYERSLAFYLLLALLIFIPRAMMESQSLLLFKSDPIFASIPIVTTTVYYTNKHKCGMFHPLKRKQKVTN